MSHERFGVSPSVLEKAEHLRDILFPQAGVRLYLDKQHAYAVTPQQDLIDLGPLQSLTDLSDAQVLQAIAHALNTHAPQKRSLLELRVQARFFSQPALAHFINEQFATERQPSIISTRTIWRAENGYPIAQTTALLILAALQARGVDVTQEDINWVIGHQGKRKQPSEGSAPSF
jgi:hypothetical protein